LAKSKKKMSCFFWERATPPPFPVFSDPWLDTKFVNLSFGNFSFSKTTADDEIALNGALYNVRNIITKFVSGVIGVSWSQFVFGEILIRSPQAEFNDISD